MVPRNNRSLRAIFLLGGIKMEQLLNLEEVRLKISQVKTLNELNDLRVFYLGKKSQLNAAMAKMATLSVDEKAKFGAMVNSLKVEVTAMIELKKTELEQAEINAKIANQTLDITLPGNDFSAGGKAIINHLIDEISQIGIKYGFAIEEGPELESDKYNFEMLNLPQDHPARDMQDSFYLDANNLLRTHTSPVQVRTLLAKKGQGPVKILCPGKVYRRDNDDATHSHQFHQIEGLVVDEGINMSDLKGFLTILAKEMFGEKRTIRLRSSFFPFTEPSVEVDVSCYICEGKGCNLCKHTGWIEILGAGMVHPEVLKMAGYDPKRYTGYAFGVGIERIAMLRYGIDDIRHFYSNDLRVIRQFKKER
jgi:phenylalanyl-tRNA synthetase alpha chain